MAAYERIAGTVLTLPCEECGAAFPFEVKSKGRRALYCSDGCRKTARNRQAKAKYVAIPRSYSSVAHHLICVECGAAFQATIRSQQCCGRECGWKLARRKQNVWRAAQAKKRHARTCRECGKAFTMHRPSGKAIRGLSNEGQFCSLVCAGSEKRWPSYLEKRRAIRRMKKRAVFDPVDVFERDGWRCIRCGDEVARDATSPDPSSPCVNLIIPSAKGGKRDWNNVALTHLTCAVERRARDLRVEVRSPHP